MNPTEEDRNMGTRAASVIALLAGVWLILSPWVYQASSAPGAWNSWIVGAIIAIFAAFRLGSKDEGTVALSWLNCLLAIWTFASPWIYGYTANEGRFINSLCVGVIVFIAALRSATSSRPHMQHPLPKGV